MMTRTVLDFTISLVCVFGGGMCREGKKEGKRKGTEKESMGREGGMHLGCIMRYCFKKKIEYINICTYI